VHVRRPLRFFFAFLLGSLAVAASVQGPYGLVPLAAMKRPPVLEIRYATPFNFTRTQLYPFPAAWLRPEAVAALEEVQADLAKQGLGLKVFDAYRPLSVQRKMWDLIHDERYVSNPAVNRGRHTRGTAVDVTLVDERGNEIAMPTGFDDFTPRAHAHYDGEGVTAEQKKDRALLARVMTAHGFEVYPFEWWHFDLSGWKKFPPLDVGFDVLAAGREAPNSGSRSRPAATPPADRGG
jgi:D-alanyl-D-alanine dipeptidase